MCRVWVFAEVLPSLQEVLKGRKALRESLAGDRATWQVGRNDLAGPTSVRLVPVSL